MKIRYPAIKWERDKNSLQILMFLNPPIIYKWCDEMVFKL